MSVCLPFTHPLYQSSCRKPGHTKPYPKQSVTHHHQPMTTPQNKQVCLTHALGPYIVGSFKAYWFSTVRYLSLKKKNRRKKNSVLNSRSQCSHLALHGLTFIVGKNLWSFFIPAGICFVWLLRWLLKVTSSDVAWSCSVFGHPRDCNLKSESSKKRLQFLVTECYLFCTFLMETHLMRRERGINSNI